MPRRSMLKSPLLALALLAASPALAAGRLQTAIFAGGCFWTMEHGLETIPGVMNAVSGYTGGSEPNPTYEQVSSEETHHVLEWIMLECAVARGKLQPIRRDPKHALVCAECGYGAVRTVPPVRCPMCHHERWIPEPWRPFSRALAG